VSDIHVSQYVLIDVAWMPFYEDLTFSFVVKPVLLTRSRSGQYGWITAAWPLPLIREVRMSGFIPLFPLYAFTAYTRMILSSSLHRKREE